MRLEQIIGNCGAIDCRGNMKKEISAICSDSRKIVPGSMFIAVKATQVTATGISARHFPQVPQP